MSDSAFVSHDDNSPSASEGQPVSAVAPMKLYPTKDSKMVSAFWAEKFDKDAEKHWDVFYKNNQEKFFKDRHYLFREFPGLTPPDGATEHRVLELGCGAGNTVYPVLESDPRILVACCDFSHRAVQLVRQHPQYDPERVNAFQCDITAKDLTDNVSQGSVDAVMLIFVLSAISPSKMPAAIRNLAVVMRRSTESRVFVRDYAAGDLAEERLESKSHRKISDNFYVRGDGTRAYYFTEEVLRTLFEAEGFETVEMQVKETEVENRARKLKMDRRWIQAHFRLRDP